MPSPHFDEDLLPTRASLLLRMKDWQDNQSWQEFFDTYWKLVYGIARKSELSDAEAQDVVQEVLRSVARKMPEFQYDPSRGSFKSWLLILTRWRILGQIRKRGPLASAQPLDGDPDSQACSRETVADPASANIDAIWEQEWQQNMLEAALNRLRLRLDPEKLQIFEFYVRKEWPAERVATQFGISIDQVYLAKHRVTEAIKAEVERLEKEVT